MTRRIMRAFKMAEISAVDRPAQIGARATIMKRDDRVPPVTITMKRIEDMSPEDVKKMIDDAVKAAVVEITKTDAPTEAQITERVNTAVTSAVTKAVADTKTAMEADFAKRAEIAKADETFESDGVTIRKSEVGESTFKILKSQAEKLEVADFEKRATTDIPHLPGELTLKAKCLRAISKLDKEVSEGIIAMLKGGSAAVKTMTKSSGHDLPVEARTAEDQIEALTKAEMAKDGKLSHAEAYTKVLDTPEGAKLYNDSQMAKRAAVKA